MRIELDPASIEAVAQRVVELLRSEGLARDLVDATAIAERFGLSRDYVYSHAEQLGAVRLGDGPRARLRFDPVAVAEQLRAGESRTTGLRRRRPARGDQLLPVRGR